MKKNIMIHLLILLLFAELAYASETPQQDIKNTKGFASINYDRQDSEQTGTQKIINDHSAFNINILIIKKGALFNNNEENAKDEMVNGQ